MPAIGSQINYAKDTVVASAAHNTSNNTNALPGYSGASILRMQLNVTAASETTPTLDVVVENTLNSTNWNVISTFAQKTAMSREIINVTIAFANRVRVR